MVLAFSLAMRSANSFGDSESRRISGIFAGCTTNSIPAFLNNSCRRGEAEASTRVIKAQAPAQCCQSVASCRQRPLPQLAFFLRLVLAVRACRDSRPRNSRDELQLQSRI